MSTPTKCVVFFSGGLMSWASAKRAVAKYGAENTTLLFTDTLIKDADLYRFLDEAAANVGARLVKIADGRTPWQVFRDKKLIGSGRKDPCSEILKRNLGRSWLKANVDPQDDGRLKRVPMSMTEFREAVQGGLHIDMFTEGGCGCFLDEAEAA